MKMRRISLAFICSLTFFCFSCGERNEADPTFPFDEAQVRHVMDSVAKLDGGEMYADAYFQTLYQSHKGDSTGLLDTLYWVSPYGMDERAEILLDRLAEAEDQGISPTTFSLKEMTEDLQAFRKLRPDSCTQSEVTQLLGRLEYRLSHAYIRYAYGQRYGYVRPGTAFNRAIGSSKSDGYRHIFDIDFEQATDSFYLVAISKLEDADAMQSFLSDIQPTDSTFYRLCREYCRAKKAGESQRADLARLNMERMRWRFDRPGDKGRYVFVNIPSYMLEAHDKDANKSLCMKVCCGKSDHQTPLLNSKINKLELNPYWNVPYNIIKNEVAPRHAGDSGYYARNRMVAIDHNTGKAVSAASLSASQWQSGRYGLRQDRGAGNSLGRLIFRFPNRFAVYLHDTNSPGAFSRDVRAVSHGCVRVQNPLDLAVFLMGNPSGLLVDKVRVAIDKEPLTEEGRTYKANTSKSNYMKSYDFDPNVPVYIHYYTLFPDSAGTIKSYNDIYNYDGALLKMLNNF